MKPAQPSYHVLVALAPTLSALRQKQPATGQLEVLKVIISNHVESFLKVSPAASIHVPSTCDQSFRALVGPDMRQSSVHF